MIDTRWDILLLGGASGLGKSRAAAELAREQGAFIVEFDDVVGAVQAITDAETHPGLHHFNRLPDSAPPSPDRELQLQIATAIAMEPAVVGVVGNRLTVPVPAVVEGDYITPAAAARAIRAGAAAGRSVRAVFLHEDDVTQVVANYADREPELGSQTQRAEVGVRYSRWLADRAAQHGLPVVACRPWRTLTRRITQADVPDGRSAAGRG
ncbi:hypothetical protein ACIRL2_43830 [Embleya sp. NPDC127516]|uniref:hypothetical protein n=1 Tax=Embleya sp. NPDC127516 TaxID=3363990 RepID=UPI0037F49848